VEEQEEDQQKHCQQHRQQQESAAGVSSRSLGKSKEKRRANGIIAMIQRHHSNDRTHCIELGYYSLPMTALGVTMKGS
jgi:hypothetical protein